ncbi:hypothetical protein, partial [Pantoea septica]|uniref:hypothetical protein n=1 Tax=Pantoea septica TaxID=472695 RepID=UPI0028AE581F
ATGLGPVGRRFESSLADHFINLLEKAGFFSSAGKRVVDCLFCADANGMDGSQSRFTHPCALGPRHPCRGTLCSSVHAIRVLTEELPV